MRGARDPRLRAANLPFAWPRRQHLMEVCVKPLKKSPLVREAQVTGLGREECAELVA